MKVKYDFHIHTALSPCALEEMTPNNIVNMAIISDLQAIAITDHNSAGNVESVLAVAEKNGLIVLPGIEVETREEIHVVCLFSSLDSVYKMQQFIYDHLPKLKNKPKVLGNQVLMDSEDEVIGEESRLLSFATSLTFEEVIDLTWSIGGIAIPAHIDRPSYSVISNLGMLPINDKLYFLEVSQYADYSNYCEKYKMYHVIQSSDAHELGHIAVCNQWLDIPCEKLTKEIIINYLRTKY